MPTAQHVGVGHARHGQVGVGFAAAVAGRPGAQQAGIVFVLQVALEYAALDQRGGPGGRALIVNVERAAPVFDRAVINHGHLGRGHPLADAPGKGGGLLAVEIAFQPVADRLVQEDPGPARPQYHGHGAGRGRLGPQVDQGLFDGFVHIAERQVVMQKILIAKAPAAARAAPFDAPVLLDDDIHVQPDQWPHIGAQQALIIGDQDRGMGTGQADQHLPHPGVLAAGRAVQPFQQIDLVFGADGVQRVLI